MNYQITLKKRRLGVVINSLSLVSAVVIFEFIKYSESNITVLSILAILSLLICITSFVFIYWKTKLWKFVHVAVDKLDERQVHVVHNSLRISYSIFVIVCLLIIYIYAILFGGPIDAVIAAGLLYLSHILPASIIAWSEKEI